MIYTDRVVARAALESSARGWWIATPTSTEQRVRRVLNERLHDMSEQLRTPQRCGWTTRACSWGSTTGDVASNRQEWSSGSGSGHNDRTDDLWVGDQRPGPSAILGRFGDAHAGAGYDGPRQGEVLQRVYSAYVHASPSALRAPAADGLDEVALVGGVRRPASLN